MDNLKNIPEMKAFARMRQIRGKDYETGREAMLLSQFKKGSIADEVEKLR